MKFQRFHIESTMQPYEVEEDEWVMEPSPERFGIRLLDVDSGLDGKDAMRRIADWCNDRRVWVMGTLLYFDTEADRLEFELTWL